MRTIPIVSSALFVLSLAAAAGAQQPSQPDARPKVDVDQLPVDVNRIQKQLQQSNERQDGSGLNLRFFIAVYAAAPPIQLFTQQDNLTRGPVPYGAPTHSDMMQITIPQEYRAPAADFSALTRWLASRAKKN